VLWIKWLGQSSTIFTEGFLGQIQELIARPCDRSVEVIFGRQFGEQSRSKKVLFWE
jgi:hypothetical protein